MKKLLPFALSFALFIPTPSRADSDSGAAKFASGTGTALYLGVGTLLPLVTDGRAGKERSLRAADSILTSIAISEGLKHLVHERRPDNSGDDSFPSTHTTAAFALATVQSHYHPKRAVLWYGGAALIGASRVELNKHHWHDVAAGAALGYFTAKLELRQSRGLVLRPFIKHEGGTRTVQGLQMTHLF